MPFTLQELEANSQHLQNAKNLAQSIINDPTVGGIFPNAANGDFSSPNIERFKGKFCSWWPLAKKLLKLAKVFTNSRIDAIIDQLIELGDSICM